MHNTSKEKRNFGSDFDFTCLILFTLVMLRKMSNNYQETLRYDKNLEEDN